VLGIDGVTRTQGPQRSTDETQEPRDCFRGRSQKRGRTFHKTIRRIPQPLTRSSRTCENNPEAKQVFAAFSEIIVLMDVLAEDFAKSVHRNNENQRFYIDALEEYSTELDGTLTELFERARNEADEQIKQQEELRRRTSPDYYTA
jgi:hypothetical protein